MCVCVLSFVLCGVCVCVLAIITTMLDFFLIQTLDMNACLFSDFERLVTNTT